MKLQHLGLLVLLSISCAPQAHAPKPSEQHPMTTVATQQFPNFVTPDQFNFRQIMGDPPKDDSPEHVDEVELMLELQATRTPEQEARCRSQEKVSVFNYSEAIGPWFTAQNLPKTAELMNAVYDQTKTISDAAKKGWSRVRPPRADERIHPCVAFENSPSYPSGHATRGITWAVILSEIFPEKREALFKIGREIGTNRYMAGMHYPSDVKAGQKLGEEVAKKFLANPEFRKQLEEIRKECAPFLEAKRRAA